MTIPLRGPRGSAKLGPPFRALIRATLAGEGARPGEIGVLLADDARLRELNRQWRGIDRATDVLSFPYSGPRRKTRGSGASGSPSPPVISGDLVISLDRAIEQARRYRVSLGRELARLLVHGTLHLAGHDHHRAAERRIMRLAEARAMRAGRDAVRALDALLDRNAFRRGERGSAP